MTPLWDYVSRRFDNKAARISSYLCTVYVVVWDSLCCRRQCWVTVKHAAVGPADQAHILQKTPADTGVRATSTVKCLNWKNSGFQSTVCHFVLPSSSLNQNPVYCQVGCRMWGICFGVLVHNNKTWRKIKSKCDKSKQIYWNISNKEPYKM